MADEKSRLPVPSEYAWQFFTVQEIMQDRDSNAARISFINCGEPVNNLVLYAGDAVLQTGLVVQEVGIVSVRFGLENSEKKDWVSVLAPSAVEAKNGKIVKADYIGDE